MAGAWTTINILDATGTSKTMRVWSENSTTGPYSFGQALDDGSGAGVIPAIKAGAALPSASTDPALVVTIRDINANVNADNVNSLLPGAPVAAFDYYGNYETVAASQTDQIMGASGAAGNYLAGVLIVPGTTAAGAVSIKDGAGSAITIFAGGGTTALTTLIPFFVPLGIYCATSWKITTGTNVTAIGIGKFT
jgi:hypothetical protein